MHGVEERVTADIYPQFSDGRQTTVNRVNESNGGTTIWDQ